MAVISLDYPLCQTQIDAANALHAALVGWQRADEVLASLARYFPSNTSEAHVLPKAIVLNSLYVTSVLAIQAMAKHVAEVLAEAGDQPVVEVVEKIAWLRGLGKDRDKNRRFLSFASKYCHFFVDPGRFPILDDFAGRALSYHLGRRNRSPMRGTADDYPSYMADIDRLRAAGGLACDYTQLDHYLWLCGQWLEYLKRKESGKPGPINGEVWSLFRSPRDASARAVIQAAFGAPD
jgi:hypothetical protein